MPGKVLINTCWGLQIPVQIVSWALEWTSLWGRNCLIELFILQCCLRFISYFMHAFSMYFACFILHDLKLCLSSPSLFYLIFFEFDCHTFLSFQSCHCPAQNLAPLLPPAVMTLGGFSPSPGSPPAKTWRLGWNLRMTYLAPKLPGVVPLRYCERSPCFLAQKSTGQEALFPRFHVIAYMKCVRLGDLCQILNVIEEDALLFSCPMCNLTFCNSGGRGWSPAPPNCNAGVCGYSPLSFHFLWLLLSFPSRLSGLFPEACQVCTVHFVQLLVVLFFSFQINFLSLRLWPNWIKHTVIDPIASYFWNESLWKLFNHLWHIYHEKTHGSQLQLQRNSARLLAAQFRCFLPCSQKLCLPASIAKMLERVDWVDRKKPTSPRTFDRFVYETLS